MSSPSWSDIRKTSAYKDGRREVAELINAALYPTAMQLTEARGIIDKLISRVEMLETEVAALKSGEQARDGRVEEARPSASGPLEVPKFGAV